MTEKVTKAAGLGKAVERYMDYYQASSLEGLKKLEDLLAFTESQAKERFEKELQEETAKEKRNPRPWDFL